MQYSRRDYLKIVGTTTGSLVASAHSLNGSWFSDLFISNNEVPGIPRQWVSVSGEEVYQYANYILSLNLKHITPRMVIAPHFKIRGRVQNSLPPRNMWSRIKSTLKVVDMIAETTGTDIKEILSAYRSPAYNRAVCGRSKSLHKENNAVDIVFDGMSSYKAVKAARHLRDVQKEFKGGIGLYRGFIHVDTRGTNYSW